jgi:hypothetical protein
MLRHTSESTPRTFGLGETELGISTLDADGVALTAIQGLNAKFEPSEQRRMQRSRRCVRS